MWEDEEPSLGVQIVGMQKAYEQPCFIRETSCWLQTTHSVT